MGVYSTTQAVAYADKIKAVYEHLGEIRKVADRLTPVEDMTSFRAQIEALYADLDVLVETAGVIANATSTGEAILTGSKASIQALLDIGVFPDGIVWEDELAEALGDLQQWVGVQLQPLLLDIDNIKLVADDYVQWKQTTQTEIDGLRIDYDNLLLGDTVTAQNIEQLQNRLTVNEQNITTYGERLDSMDQSVANVVTGMNSANDIINGHTSTIASLANSTTLLNESIDSLSSELTNANTNITANTDAIDLISTSITAIGDDIVAQSNRTTQLQSVIGGSGNILPNADYAAGANGWSIIVAEEDWASTVLTLNTFTMPPEVNCLEVLGSPTPNGKIVVESPPVLVKAGEWMGVSGYPCCDNGVAELTYKAFNAAGAVVDQGACPLTFNVTTNPQFVAYQRTWVKALMPAGAQTLRLYFTVTGDGDFITQGALFRPMVEKAWAEQEEPSAWTPNVGAAVDALSTAVQTLSTTVSGYDDAIEAISEASTELTARVGAMQGALTNEIIIRASKDAVQAGALNVMESRLVSAEGTVTAAAAIAQSMDTRVTATENGIEAAAAALLELETEVDGDIATAISGLTTMINTTNGNVTAVSNSVTSLTTTVNGNTASISTQATAINGLKSEWGVTLDVNGYISGLFSQNNGSKADFTILANNFKIVTPGKTPRTLFSIGSDNNTQIANDMYFGNGRIILDNGAFMKVSGLGFGTANQFIEWFGPKMAISACSESNAIQYLKTNGSAYFGGSLSAGVLRNSLSTTLLSATELILGPFSTNGNPKTLVTSFGYDLNGMHSGGDYTSTYNGIPHSATIDVYRSINGGGWTYLQSFGASGTSEAYYIADDGFPGGSTYVTASMGGSMTLTDFTGATTNLRFRAVISARNAPIGLNGGSQNLTMISTEQ